MRKALVLPLMLLLLLTLGLVLVIPVSATPGIASCDSEGNTKNIFNLGESVYLKGSGLRTNSMYYYYIYDDYEPWIPGTTSHTVLSAEGYTQYRAGIIETDSNGYIKNQPVEIYRPEAGKYDLEAGKGYDIWLDWVPSGTLDTYDETDRLDNFDVGTAGFFVIPEYALGALLALAACFSAFILHKKGSIPKFMRSRP